MTSGRCTNFGMCALADTKIAIQIPPGSISVPCPGGCGREVPASRNVQYARTSTRTSVPTASISYENPLIWPFQQQGWPLSLWMPLIWWALPPFTTFISAGWVISAIRRRVRLLAPLPESDELGTILKDGLVVTLMYLIIFVVPLILVEKITGLNWLSQLIDAGMWVENNLIREAKHEPTWTFLAREALRFVTAAEIPLIYVVLMTPAFEVGRVRYAITGRILSWLNIAVNFLICLRHLGSVLLFLFLVVVTQVVSSFFAVIFLGTGIGSIISIILTAASTWIFASFAGDLALRISRDANIG